MKHIGLIITTLTFVVFITTSCKYQDHSRPVPGEGGSSAAEAVVTNNIESKEVQEKSLEENIIEFNSEFSMIKADDLKDKGDKKALSDKREKFYDLTKKIRVQLGFIHNDLEDKDDNARLALLINVHNYLSLEKVYQSIWPIEEDVDLTQDSEEVLNSIRELVAR